MGEQSKQQLTQGVGKVITSVQDTKLSQPTVVVHTQYTSLFDEEVAPPPVESVGWQETLTALQYMREAQSSTPVGGRL